MKKWCEFEICCYEFELGRRNVILIKRAQKEDLEEILKLQYLAYQSEARLFGNKDIPPLKQTIEEIYDEFQKGAILKAV